MYGSGGSNSPFTLIFSRTCPGLESNEITNSAPASSSHVPFGTAISPVLSSAIMVYFVDGVAYALT